MRIRPQIVILILIISLGFFLFLFLGPKETQAATQAGNCGGWNAWVEDSNYCGDDNQVTWVVAMVDCVTGVGIAGGSISTSCNNPNYCGQSVQSCTGWSGAGPWISACRSCWHSYNSSASHPNYDPHASTTLLPVCNYQPATFHYDYQMRPKSPPASCGGNCGYYGCDGPSLSTDWANIVYKFDRRCISGAFCPTSWRDETDTTSTSISKTVVDGQRWEYRVRIVTLKDGDISTIALYPWKTATKTFSCSGGGSCSGSHSWNAATYLARLYCPGTFTNACNNITNPCQWSWDGSTSAHTFTGLGTGARPDLWVYVKDNQNTGAQHVLVLQGNLGPTGACSCPPPPPPSCTYGPWQDQGCGEGPCDDDEMWVTRTKSDPLCTGDVSDCDPRPECAVCVDQAPGVPGLVSPSPSGVIGVDINADLDWSSGGWGRRCAGDNKYYKVYFGTTDPPPWKTDTNSSTTLYDPGSLNYNTTYYWQIRQCNFGCTNSPVWSFTTEPAPLPCDTSFPNNYFHACYYIGTSFDTFRVNEDETTVLSSPVPINTSSNPPIDHYWDTGEVNALGQGDNVSAIWRGTFNFPAGKYIFRVNSDDGVKVDIGNNGSWEIDQWHGKSWADPKPHYSSAPISLNGNTQIKLEWYEGGGQAGIKLWWEQAPNNSPQITSLDYDEIPNCGPPPTINIRFKWDLNDIDGDQMDWQLIVISGLDREDRFGNSGNGTVEQILPVYAGGEASGNGALGLGRTYSWWVVADDGGGGVMGPAQGPNVPTPSSLPPDSTIQCKAGDGDWVDDCSSITLNYAQKVQFKNKNTPVADWYEWDFDTDGVIDESGSTDQEVEHFYSMEGIYTITHKVTKGGITCINNSQTVKIRSPIPKWKEVAP